MKRIPLYDDLGLQDEEQVFEHLTSSFSDAIRTWDYFVNWDKVFKNSKELELQLGIWDYLLGKDDFDEEFRYLVSRYPEIVQAIPSLIVRDGSSSKNFHILSGHPDNTRSVEEFNFKRPAEGAEDIEKALQFVKKTGLVKIFEKNGVKNLYDYLVGVEAGVDSNGRKNRSGAGMESLIEEAVQALVSENPGWRYKAGANNAFLASNWGQKVDTGNAKRIFDFAIQAGSKLVLIEVNIYGGGGSKLKSVAGEFIGLHEHLQNQGITLVWVTDGLGWLTTKRALHDSFLEMHHILNLSLLRQGALAQIMNSA
jgi:type II restriction enzyme